MSHDGQDPPKLEPTARAQRPKLSVIVGGGNRPSDKPEPPALARSSVSPEGRATVLRALRMLGGERAFLFVWDEQEFTLSEACAADETGAEPRDRNVMWSLLDRITSQRAPLVMAGTDDQPTDAMMSGVTAPLRMAVAVPLLSGDNLKGVACFDKRIHRGQYVVSDAQSAVSLLSALGVDAARLGEVLRGSAEPHAQVSAHAIVASLLPTLCPPEAKGCIKHVTLAAPSEGEVHFWHAQDRGEGSERLIACRLDNRGAHPDLLVTRTLASVRALSLLADASADDQLNGMTFELERTSKEPFALHATAIELTPRDRSVGVWQAGEGAVFRTQASGGAERLIEPSAPLARGRRGVAKASAQLAPGDRVICIQRAQLWDADGQSAVARDLENLANLPVEAAAAAFREKSGPGTSAFWLTFSA